MSFGELNFVLIATAACAMALLWLLWIWEIGFFRAGLASLCRVGWMLPVFLAFFPETTAKRMPASLMLSPVNILVDDSDSMKVEEQNDLAKKLLSVAENECARLGCLPKVTRLSELKSETQQGFSPLNDAIDPWLYRLGHDSWMLISDGGDWHPTLSWEPRLKGLGLPEKEGGSPRGHIFGLSPPEKNNIWIATVDAPPLSFQDKPIAFNVVLNRSKPRKNAERIQLQVLSAEKILASNNAEFRPEDESIVVSMVIPPLERGQHLLSIKALPTGDEKALWDNTVHAQIEVLPNTVGVLHLLGAPSWDGRFLRRFFKSEPKYDLISFFILRDPWDSQSVNERELSLIPFPVERLFNEELPNFRIVVIQNFALFQFLQPEYQQNLVKFVKDGGGLLFMGGPRALQSGDLSSSALGEILPFVPPKSGNAANPNLNNLSGNNAIPFGGDFRQFRPDFSGPFYDPDLPFKIELANPPSDQRSLANVYDDWEVMADDLRSLSDNRGIHHMENVVFKSKDYTPLLDAKMADGRKWPLAVASYPGKGRAIWLFSDNLWHMAMGMGDDVSRQAHSKFLQSSMNWLLREDIKKPLVAKNLRLRSDGVGNLRWQVDLQGSAAKYFRGADTEQWQVVLCGQKLTADQNSSEKLGSNERQLSGVLPISLSGGQRCRFEITGYHPAFGSVKAQITEVFPETYSDKEIGAAPNKLRQLAALTGAELTLAEENKDPQAALIGWLEKVSKNEGVALPDTFKSIRNFYWMFERWWIWLVLLLLPLEVLIRRWHVLFATSSNN